MEIKKGYVYHIKDEYFEVVQDKTLMRNHENGKARPTYFCVKENNSDILWFIPMSSKVEKYKEIRDKKIKKYGNCDSILIKQFLGQDSVFLLQNMFPTIEKYVDHVHIINGTEARVIDSVARELEANFYKIMGLIKQGKKVIFTDVSNDLNKIKEEL
ncbi:MAG: hypothetical protein HFJ50_09480 [Clostridia bacterium]|nr:hypothetical protein [Clostridia bacterium]